jgi:hypothetical protein
MRECCHCCPDAGDDEHRHRGEVAEQREPTAHVIGPAGDGHAKAYDERQSEIDAERRCRGILLFAFATLGVTLLAELRRRRFRRETIVLSLDLSELDRPIDFAQLTLLAWAG